MIVIIFKIKCKLFTEGLVSCLLFNNFNNHYDKEHKTLHRYRCKHVCIYDVISSLIALAYNVIALVKLSYLKIIHISLCVGLTICFILNHLQRLCDHYRNLNTKL